MDTEIFQTETDRISRCIISKYSPSKIVLYGSCAWGNPTEGSDIDLLIIKNTDKPFLERMREIYRIVYDLHYKVAFEPVVYTPQEIENMIQNDDHFIKEIMGKGKVLYDKQG